MTDRRRFRKSWGAELEEDGTATFRIWAPSQGGMSVRVAGGADLPMPPIGEGWFELRTNAVAPGGGYSFVLPDGMAVNDPAAREQIDGVDGPSRLIDPEAYVWRTADWRGRPWEETVFYEAHVGAFSPEGTFDGMRDRLDHLAGLGVTALELMPVAQFGGGRGWGYDGVLLYAPHVAYGGPDGLKRLIDAAHERGLMMFLDVVYNHFGPDGNFLSLYAPEMFHPERHTPWGAAIAYEKKPVRDFFIENALYWLEEYRFDGLRLDAIDQIDMHSEEPILEEIAAAVRAGIADRHVHLTTEDDRNIVRLHERDGSGRPKLYSAEWNDDVHHAFHVIASGETDGYYDDFAEKPVPQLARALASGYIFQGEPSLHRGGKLRGVDSAHLPPTAFVNFLQNHDQIGNRAFNERLTALSPPATLEALTAILLLGPQIPLLFMGEEYGETRAFNFFTDFHGELGEIVREGRRKEFAKWPAFAHEDNRDRIADPNAEATLQLSRLDWDKLAQPPFRDRLALVTELLDIRRRDIVPLMKRMGGNAGSYEMWAEKAFEVRWRALDGAVLTLNANLGARPSPLRGSVGEGGRPRMPNAGLSLLPALPRRGEGERVVFAHPAQAEASRQSGALPPMSVIVTVRSPSA